MPYSMTGFGDAQYEAEAISFMVEIKTLNNRFLKTSIRLPDSLSFAEPEIEKLIKRDLCRGSVSYVLHMRDTSDGGALKVNRAAAESYVKHLEQIATLHGNLDSITINLADLLTLPGVCIPQEYSRQQHQDLLEIKIGRASCRERV